MSQVDKSAQENQQQMNLNLAAMGGLRVPGGPANNANNGANPPRQTLPGPEQVLCTYIYDYFLRSEMYDCASALLRARQINVRPNGPQRDGSGRRAQKHDVDGNPINGSEDTNMDGNPTLPKTEDGEDGPRKPDDFPIPDVPKEDFLLDWWLIFWDMYAVSTQKAGGNPAASQYIQATQQNKRLQHSYLNIRQPPGMPGQMPAAMYANQAGMRQGMGVMAQDDNSKNLIRTAVHNNRKSTPQLHPNNKGQMVPGGPREPDSEMNGQPRPQSPAGSQTVGSPSAKRQNIAGGEYRDPTGRGQMRPGAPVAQQNNATTQMLMTNGIDPAAITQQHFANTIQGQQKMRAMQEYAQQNPGVMQAQHLMKQMPGGQPNMQMGVNPMMAQGVDGSRGMGGNDQIAEYYGTTHSGPMQPNGMQSNGIPGNTSNHALADYQMQLMVLEQQNKRRLLRARAEQDTLTQGGDGRRFEQGGNMAGMSPNARAAPSPQPQGDVKRTPKMNPAVGPGSPLPDQIQQNAMQQQRGSPAAPMPFSGPPQDGNLFYNPVGVKGLEMMGAASPGVGGMPNGPPMRPPSSHPNGQVPQQPMQDQMIGQPFRPQQPAGRGQPVSGGVWAGPGGMQQGGQPMQQLQQGGQPGVSQATVAGGVQGRPVNVNMMPPPAQPGGPVNARPPTSPNMTAQPQPPTPTQTNKTVPKKREKQKRPVKKTNSTPAPATNVATPQSEGPPTPTPDTPITPQHPNSFSSGLNNLNKGPAFTSNGPNQPNSSQPGQQPGVQPGAQVGSQSVPQPDNGVFAMGDDNEFMSFESNGHDTLLDQFDFDSFLHNTDDPTTSMTSTFGNDFGGFESVETAGESS